MDTPRIECIYRKQINMNFGVSSIFIAFYEVNVSDYQNDGDYMLMRQIDLRLVVKVRA